MSTFMTTCINYRAYELHSMGLVLQSLQQILHKTIVKHKTSHKTNI